MLAPAPRKPIHKCNFVVMMMMMMMMMWGAKGRWGNDTSDHQIHSFSQDEDHGAKSHILTSQPQVPRSATQKSGMGGPLDF